MCRSYEPSALQISTPLPCAPGHAHEICCPALQGVDPLHAIAATRRPTTANRAHQSDLHGHDDAIIRAEPVNVIELAVELFWKA